MAIDLPLEFLFQKFYINPTKQYAQSSLHLLSTMILRFIYVACINNYVFIIMYYID